MDYVYEPDLEAFVLGPDADFSEVVPPVTGEAYLELCALDLDDVAAVSRFVRLYGPLDLRYAHDEANGGLADGYQGFYMHPGWPNVKANLDRDYETAMKGAAEGVWGVSTLSEFRYGARCMRDLVTAARVARGDIAHEDARWESPVWETEADHRLEDYPWTPPRDDDYGNGAENLLEQYLTDGLVGFFPRVRVRRDRAADPPVLAGAPLWQILCLELFNHVAAETAYRTCANERCGRLFVRQVGRSQFGQHRSHGVKYCSAACAKAQANREYRRRLRSQR